MSTQDQSTPLVSVILLNWNGRKYIEQCIQSVLAQDYANIQLIVVDNGSRDDSLDTIRAKYPQLPLLTNERNLGFARGMNQGIEAAHGRYVLPLNMDVILDRGYIAAAVAAFDTDGEVGAVGGSIYSISNNQLTNTPHQGEAGGVLLRKRFQGYEAGRIAERKYVLGVAGSCPVLRRAMLDDVRLATGDYYDELYFSGWEDLDLWLRMQLRGWTCLHVPEAIAWHEGSGSVDGRDRLISKPPWYQVHVLKNRYITIIKDLPRGILLRLLPFLIITEFGLLPYFFVKSRATAVSLLKAWRQVANLLPEILRKRRVVQASRKVSADHLWRFLGPF